LSKKISRKVAKNAKKNLLKTFASLRLCERNLFGSGLSGLGFVDIKLSQKRTPFDKLRKFSGCSFDTALYF